eukprot:641620_1
MSRNGFLILIFAAVTCTLCIIVGLLFLYQYYHAYKRSSNYNSLAKQMDAFYSPKIQLIATLMIFAIIYQQIDQFFHSFSSSLAAVIIHYLYLIYIVILMKYRCNLMEIHIPVYLVHGHGYQQLDRYFKCVIYLSISGCICDLIVSIYFRNFVPFVIPILYLSLICLCYHCGYKQSFAINKTYHVEMRVVGLRIISFITALFMVSLSLLSLLIIELIAIALIAMFSGGAVHKSMILVICPNFLIIIVSTYASFGFTKNHDSNAPFCTRCFWTCIFRCCLCECIQQIITKKYEKNCTIPLLTSNVKLNMEKMKDIEDKEEHEEAQVAQHYWFNQYLLSRDMAVFAYIHDVERSFGLSVPPCVGDLVVSYCDRRIEELATYAKKHAIQVSKRMVNDILDQYDDMNRTTDGILLQFARIAMHSGKESVLKLIIDQWVQLQMKCRCETYKDSELLRETLIYAANNRLYETCQLILSDTVLKYVMFRPRPQCLLDALKQRDDAMVMIILNGLSKVKDYSFVCDDVFKECIKSDRLECAQYLVEQKWHSPTQNDYQLAERYYGGIHIWLLQRSTASMFTNI